MAPAISFMKKRSVRWTGLCLLCAVAGVAAVSVALPAKTIAAGDTKVIVRPVAAEGEKKEASKPAAGTGNLAGVITLDGDIPKPELLVTKGNAQVKDFAVCAADDVPKKLGRFCERFVGVAGCPGNGLLVSIIRPCWKNDVFPPSGAVTVGFSTVTGEDLGVPSMLKTERAAPLELNGSLFSGFCPR